MPLRDYIVNNFLWKMASVIVAILIWMTIHSNIEGSFSSFKLPETHVSSTLSRSLPVYVISTASDMRAFAITPGEVEVTVRGDDKVLNDLQLTDVQVFVNLLDVKDAKSFRKKVTVHTPPTVAVAKVVPEEVTVERVTTTNSPTRSTNQN